MKGFIILNKMIQNEIKYEVGKIYHINKKLRIHSLIDLDLEDFEIVPESKIYSVLVYDESASLKIIKEVNYKYFITENTINVINLNKISIVKLQDEQLIKNLIINREELYFKNILQTNKREYIDYLINNEEQLELSLPLFLKYNFTNNNLKELSFSKMWNNQVVVAKVGRPIDLDNLYKVAIDTDVTAEVLKNGRKKDIDRYITSNDSYLLSRIADTGINKYLDILIQNTKDDLTGAPILRCVLNHGRKKDIEKLKNSIFNQDLIKDFTDDDILKLC
jgi:hypothetical protein